MQWAVDSAPGVVVRGAVDYLKENDDVSIALVGKEKEINREFKRQHIQCPDNMEIINAHEHVLMREHFFSYWRKREKTSIKKALDLVKHNKAQAMVSAGNTGAVMAIGQNRTGDHQTYRTPGTGTNDPDSDRSFTDGGCRRKC